MKKIKILINSLLFSFLGLVVNVKIASADLVPLDSNGKPYNPNNYIPVQESNSLFDFTVIIIGVIVLSLIIGSFFLIFKIRKK